jgi:hypothetical protein
LHALLLRFKKQRRPFLSSPTGSVFTKCTHQLSLYYICQEYIGTYHLSTCLQCSHLTGIRLSCNPLTSLYNLTTATAVSDCCKRCPLFFFQQMSPTPFLLQCVFPTILTSQDWMCTARKLSSRVFNKFPIITCFEEVPPFHPVSTLHDSLALLMLIHQINGTPPFPCSLAVLLLLQEANGKSPPFPPFFARPTSHALSTTFKLSLHFLALSSNFPCTVCDLQIEYKFCYLPGYPCMSLPGLAQPRDPFTRPTHFPLTPTVCYLALPPLPLSLNDILVTCMHRYLSHSHPTCP